MELFVSIFFLTLCVPGWQTDPDTFVSLGVLSSPGRSRVHLIQSVDPFLFKINQTTQTKCHIRSSPPVVPPFPPSHAKRAIFVLSLGMEWLFLFVWLV